jgi:hypothetical protein
MKGKCCKETEAALTMCNIEIENLRKVELKYERMKTQLTVILGRLRASAKEAETENDGRREIALLRCHSDIIWVMEGRDIVKRERNDCKDY